MLQYENRPQVLGNGHTNTAQVSSVNTMGNTMGTAMDVTSADHMSNGMLQKPSPQLHPKKQHRHIWLITGPAGCGKSTVAEYIAGSLSLPFIEGDKYHTPSNIDKMSHGVPLTDQDRWDWLISLRYAAMSALSSPSSPAGVVVTCSALKQRYRDVIRIAHYNSPDILVHFVYLHASENVLLQRVGARQGHYMGADMVHSQLESLEEPTAEEIDVIKVDVSGTKDEVEAEALRRVREAVKTELVRDSS